MVCAVLLKKHFWAVGNFWLAGRVLFIMLSRTHLYIRYEQDIVFFDVYMAMDVIISLESQECLGVIAHVVIHVFGSRNKGN